MPRTLRLHAKRERPVWPLLYAIANDTAAELRVLWHSIFTDMQDSMPGPPLRAALGTGQLFQVEAVLTPIWHQVGDVQARTQLPPLLHETVHQAAQVVLPSMEVVMDTPLPPSLAIPSPETVQAIEQYSGRQITAINDTTLQNVRAVLRQGFAEGRSVQQMMRDLEAFVGLTPRQTESIEKLRTRLTDKGIPRQQVQAQVEAASTRALRLRVENIALTESMWAVNEGAYATLQNSVRQGLVNAEQVRRHWLTAQDEHTCPLCAPIPDMQPEGVGLFEPFATPAGEVLHPPLHPRCVTGDTLITPGGRVLATSKRWYEGEVVVLQIGEGATYQQLTCTPNHPILTRHAWVAAGMLKEGDDVLCCLRQQGKAAGDDDVHDMPTSIEQIVEAFGLSADVSTCEVPVAAKAFHGDGKGSQVAVINANRLLRNGVHPSRAQHRGKQTLQGRNPQSFLLSCLCAFFHSRPWLRLSFDFPMRSSRLLSPLAVRHALPFEQFGFAPPTRLNAVIEQSAPNDRARHLAMDRKRFFRHPGVIQAQQLLKVQRHNFRGHVFNLQTEDGWYISNGIITHNCRCTTTTEILEA